LKKMNNFPTKKLGEVVSTIESGKRPKGGAVSSGIPSIGVEHISDSNGFKLDGLKYIPGNFYESLNKGKLNRGDILIAKDGATTGKTVFLSDDFPFSKAAINEHIFILRGKNEMINQKFLFYILYSPQGQRQILKTKHGAAQGGIDQSFVNFVKIPLPPLEIQKQIVERMDKIAEAQKLNDELIQKADELFQSLLHKELNPAGKNWEVKKLGEVCEIARGGSPRPINNYITNSSDGINWIKIGDAKEGEKYIVSTEQKIKLEGVSKTRLVKEGDFILSNSMSFGRPYILKISGAIHDGWLLLRLKNTDLSPDFLYYILGSSQTQIQFEKSASGGVVRNLNSDLVRKIKIPVPPLKVQKQIVEKLSAAQEYKKQLFAQKSKLKELFDSVLNKSMKGELIKLKKL